MHFLNDMLPFASHRARCLQKVAKTATVKTAGAKFSKGSAASDDDNGSVTGEFHAGTIAVNEFQAILAGDPDRCSSSGGSSSAASSPAESMFSATSGSASSSVSATALPDAEAVLKKIEREQRNFIPKAKSMTATEHVSREAVALRVSGRNLCVILSYTLSVCVILFYTLIYLTIFTCQIDANDKCRATSLTRMQEFLRWKPLFEALRQRHRGLWR